MRATARRVPSAEGDKSERRRPAMVCSAIAACLFGVVALPVIASLVFAPTLHATSAILPRTTTDRPDERGGAQVHVMYLLPSDGSDRALDTNGTIAASVKNWQTPG